MRTPRLRRVVVGAALALMLALQAVAVLITGSAAERSALAVARDAIEREGETTVESILRHLGPAEQSVEVTARLLGADLLDLTAPGLEQYLYTQLAVMPPMTGIFVGFPDGGFVFVTRDDDGFVTKRITAGAERTVEVTERDASFVELSRDRTDDDPYDPRERPWYTQAADSDQVAWTDPYVFFTSGQPGVTASRAVTAPDGTVAAVVGVDVELSGLTAFIDDLAVSANGEAFVVSGETVVAAPSRYERRAATAADGSLRLLTTTELGIDPLVAGAPSEVDVHAAAGGDQLVLLTRFPDGSGLPWTAVIRAPQADFTEPLRQQQRALALIWVAGAVGLAIAAVVMARVTRPLHRLQADATIDHLTGVANRRALVEAAGRVVADAARRGTLVAAVVVDLDDFKLVNDARGHAAGDHALEQVGATLRELTRPSDVVGRLGGDEFVVVGPVVDAADAAALGERLVRGIRVTLRAAFADLDSLGASAGVCVTDGADDLDTVLARADTALLAGKAEAKGAVRVCDLVS